MLTTHARRASAVTVISLWLAACGGGAEILVIPLFEFGFSGTSGAVQIEMFLGPDKPVTSSGNFDFVNMNVDANPQVHFSGTYSGCNFNLKFKPDVPLVPLPPQIADSYSGRFTGNDRIELQPTSGIGLPVLTLQRKPNPDPGGGPTRNLGC